MPDSAFVTGATGFVGLNLVEALLRDGWNVTAMHRRGSELKYLRRFAASRVEGDVVDAASVHRAMPDGVDVVFHVAGDTGLWSGNDAAQDRINIQGTRHVVEAALAKRARRFVHTSTASVYGLQPGRIDERSPQLGLRSPINYQRSKLRAEAEVRAGIARGLDAVFLNPPGIIGRYAARGYARLFRLIAERRLPGVPGGARSFCDVRAVAGAHLSAAVRGRSGENYLLGGTDATLLDLVREIGSALDRPVPRRPTPAWILRGLGVAGAIRGWISEKAPELTPEVVRLATTTTYCDCSKAVRELGFRVVPLRDMVADCALWMTAEGLLPGVEFPAPRP